jgi:aldehyde:ferredoxin oxidoreductase
MKKLIHCATDWSFSENDIEEVGKRVIDFERMFNNREGISKKDDTLPKRYFDDPMPLNLSKGHHIDRDEFDKMLSRYYKIRNWTDDGIVKKERVKELEALA